MAFTGIPIVQMISTNIVRITGISLAGGVTSGTIGLAARTIPAEITLPPAFRPRAYRAPGGPPNGGIIDLVDAIGVDVRCTSIGGAILSVPCVDKAGGTPDIWMATVTNPLAGIPTNLLEIYIKYHD